MWGRREVPIAEWSETLLGRTVAALGRGAGGVRAKAATVCLTALLVMGTAYAQDPARRTDANDALWIKHQTWDYFGGRKSFGWSLDFIIRRQGPYEQIGFVTHRQRESVRPWLVWQINPTSKLSLAPLSYHFDGGIRATEDTRDGVFRHELRSTLEYDMAAFPHEWVMVSSRYRLEFRHMWYPDGGDRTVIRLRLRPRVRVSLNKRNYYDNGAIYAFTYNEVAVHYGAPEQAPLAFNQNRFFLGLGHRFERYLRIEAGFVHQWTSRGGGNEYLVSTGPMVYFTIDYLSAFLKDQKRARRERAAEAAEALAAPPPEPPVPDEPPVSDEPPEPDAPNP